jgi:peptidoglycan/LPS O-acetylase OafA/YrhL
MTDTRVRRRTVGQIIVAALFALLAANAIEEAIWSDSPPALRVWQVVVFVLAGAAAWGAWTGARWSAVLALLYGVVAGAMVVCLGPMLDMPVEERGGLWLGGAIVLVIGLVCAWYLRRVTSRGSTDSMRVD